MAEALAFQLRRLEAMQNAGTKILELPRLGRDVFSGGSVEGVKVIRSPVYELTLYEQAKNESFSIQPGQTYVKVEGVWDGEFTVFRARPEVHALCIKHNIYDC